MREARSSIAFCLLLVVLGGAGCFGRDLMPLRTAVVTPTLNCSQVATAAATVAWGGTSASGSRAELASQARDAGTPPGPPPVSAGMPNGTASAPRDSTPPEPATPEPAAVTTANAPPQAAAPASSANVATAPPPFAPPTFKGLNYGEPTTADGRYLGTRWLIPGAQGWDTAKQALSKDLDAITANDLGHVVRIFIGLDQAIVWDPSAGYVRFVPAALDELRQAFDMFDAHSVRVIAVLFDQEEQASPGNFRFQALDGAHPTMERNYLRAVTDFMAQFGARSTVLGWDLFNEPYGSLGPDGHLPRPPASDPVSPNYPDSVVHAWVRELYVAAKCAAPSAWLTVSDSLYLYWRNPPDVSPYQDSVDFYDIHVYDDTPKPPKWTLDKPFILGEVGASIDRQDFMNQRLNSRAVSYWLCSGRGTGAAAVLAHDSDGEVFGKAGQGGLTPTGYVVGAAQP